MISDELGQKLHDRATRGEALNEQETAYLDEWYTAQDVAESAMLQLQNRISSESDLPEQITMIMRQLTVVTQTIQSLSQENAALRDEIAMLRQHVSLPLTLQTA